MDSEEESVCRICGEDAQYNIFQDELVINNRNMKIYIVLNNFIFEKLYGPDEFSNVVCMNCCDNLFNSYKFMLKVRDAEHKLRTEGQPMPKRTKQEFKEEEAIEQLSPIADPDQDDLLNEPVLNGDILEENFSDEEIIAAATKEDKIISKSSPSIKRDVIKKKSKTTSSSEYILDTITITNFSLVYKEENDKVIANIQIDYGTIRNAGNTDYNLDKWLEKLSHSAVYSCTFCVKGFSSCDFLLKHLTSCHVCITCFKICETNKLLNQHMKIHNEEKLVCPFCGKVCTYNVYRQHIRKQHVLNLPFYVGVLPHNLEPACIE